MRILVAVVLAVAVAGSGCAVVHGHGTSRAAVKSQKCPTGHVWSDGACHSKGKGHDK